MGPTRRRVKKFSNAAHAAVHGKEQEVKLARKAAVRARKLEEGKSPARVALRKAQVAMLVARRKGKSKPVPVKLQNAVRKEVD